MFDLPSTSTCSCNFARRDIENSGKSAATVEHLTQIGAISDQTSFSCFTLLKHRDVANETSCTTAAAIMWWAAKRKRFFKY